MYFFFSHINFKRMSIAVCEIIVWNFTEVHQWIYLLMASKMHRKCFIISAVDITLCNGSARPKASLLTKRFLLNAINLFLDITVLKIGFRHQYLL
jgi:hypothetical protein